MSKLSFIVIPDSQKAVRYFPQSFQAIADAVEQNDLQRDIQFALHVGDVVDEGAMQPAQFQFALEQLHRLNAYGVATFVAPGNHDYDCPITSANNALTGNRRSLQAFNDYFQQLHFEAWHVTTYEPSCMENFYATRVIDGMQLFVVVLEFMPRKDVLVWLDEAVAAHPHHDMLVVTHCYMNIDGKRVHNNRLTNPKYKYAAVADGLDGEEMWQQHFAHYPNVRAIFSGHHLPTNAAHRIDTGKAGNAVLQCFYNWQEEPAGGEGRICVVDWDCTQRSMQLQVVNTVTKQPEQQEGYHISFTY